MGGMGDMGGSFNPDSVQPFPSSHFQPNEPEAEANFSNSDCYDDGSKDSDQTTIDDEESKPLAIPTNQAPNTQPKKIQSNFSISFTNGKFGEDLLVGSNDSIFVNR